MKTQIPNRAPAAEITMNNMHLLFLEDLFEDAILYVGGRRDQQSKPAAIILVEKRCNCGFFAADGITYGVDPLSTDSERLSVAMHSFYLR